METENGLGKRNMRKEDDEDLPRRRTYERRLTVLVEIEGEDRVTMMELLKKVREWLSVVDTKPQENMN